jgi:AraC family transcriptional regulator
MERRIRGVSIRHAPASETRPGPVNTVRPLRANPSRKPWQRRGTEGAILGSLRTLNVPAVEVVRSGRTSALFPLSPQVSSSTAEWDGMAFEMSRIAPCVIPDHEHPTHLVHLVAEGTARTTAIVGGRTFSDPCPPGMVMLVPRGTRDRTAFHAPVTLVSLALHPQLLTRAVESERAIELRFEWRLADRQIAAVLSALHADLQGGSPAGRLFGESLGVALAVYLARRYPADPVRAERVRGGLPTYRLRRVLEYMDAHLERDVSLGDLAGVAGLSPHYFAELFRQRTGTTPHRFVLERRIERAKRLLRDRTRTILDVAVRSGFKDQSHFGRVFRQIVGATPSGYRAGL